MSARRTAPAAFQWPVFPVVMAGAVAASMYAMGRGSAAPEHRWHHFKTVEEANHNHGQTVLLC